VRFFSRARTHPPINRPCTVAIHKGIPQIGRSETLKTFDSLGFWGKCGTLFTKEFFHYQALTKKTGVSPDETSSKYIAINWGPRRTGGPPRRRQPKKRSLEEELLVSRSVSHWPSQGLSSQQWDRFYVNGEPVDMLDSRGACQRWPRWHTPYF